MQPAGDPTPDDALPLERRVPPESQASPSDLHYALPDEPPWWHPGWADLARQAGWRWLLAVSLALLAIIAATGMVMYLPMLWWLGLKGVVLIVAIAIALSGYAVRRAVQAQRHPFCIHCGYNLTGLPDHHTCPECGRPYTFSLVEEYRRDPQWFIQRFRAQRRLPRRDAPFDARPSCPGRRYSPDDT